MVTRIQPAASDPEAARSVVGLLRQLPDSEPVPPASDSTQLLDSLARLAEGTVADLPEVVLVHEHIQPLPALDLIREIALRFPAVGVVLISREASQSLYSAAMDAGARGVLGLPLNYDDVAARVAAAASWAVGVRRHLGSVPDGADGPGGTVVAITGAKGGVGTTLTAVQVALAAQASGRGTALVDMDLQAGDVASYLDVQFRRSAADLAGIDDVSTRVLQDAVFAHESGLGLLLAPGEGERGEEVDDRAARQIITALRARYDIVVIDCGTQLNAANAAAIETSDTAVLLTTPDVVAVRAAKRMVRAWDRLQIRSAEETLTLVNRTSRYTEIQPPLIARIVGTPVAGTTIPSNYKELQSALDAGRIQDLEAKSSVRQALWAFAGEVGLLTGAEAAGTAGNAGNGGKQVKGAGRSAAKGTGTKAAKGTAAAPPQVLPPKVPGAGGRQALPPGGSAGAQGQPAPGQQATGAQATGQHVPGQAAAHGQGAGQASGQPAQPQRAAQGIYGPEFGSTANAGTGAEGASGTVPGAVPGAGPAAGDRPVPQPQQGAAAAAPQALSPGVAGRTLETTHEVPVPGHQREFHDHRGPAEANSAAPFHTRTRVGPVGPDIGQSLPSQALQPPRPPRSPDDDIDIDDEGETSVWGDKGGVTLEFAGMTPVILAVLAILWQCVLVGYTFSLAGNAADEAARAATAAGLSGDPEGACESAATKHLPEEWREKSKVSCVQDGHLWKADVGLTAPVLFPGAGKLPFSISGTAGAAEEG